MTIYDDNRTFGWHFHVPEDSPPADLLREAVHQASVLRDLLLEAGVDDSLAARAVVLIDVLDHLGEQMEPPEGDG